MNYGIMGIIRTLILNKLTIGLFERLFDFVCWILTRIGCGKSAVHRRGLCEVETTSCVDHVLEMMLLNVSLIVYGEQLVNICVELIFGD